MYDLLARWRMGEFAADIPLVVSNHADHAEAAESFGVEYRQFPVTPETKARAGGAGRWRLLGRRDIDLVVLARYMQILSPEFVARDTRTGSSTSITRSCRRSPAPAVPPGAPARREDHRRDGALRDRGARPGADHRAGRRAGEPPRCSGDLVRKGRDLEKVVLARAVLLHLAEPDPGLRQQDRRVLVAGADGHQGSSERRRALRRRHRGHRVGGRPSARQRHQRRARRPSCSGAYGSRNR